MSNTTIDIRNFPDQLHELSRIIIEKLTTPDSNIIQFNLVYKTTKTEPTTLFLYGPPIQLYPTDHKASILTTLDHYSLESAFKTGRFRLDSMEFDYSSERTLVYFTVTYFK